MDVSQAKQLFDFQATYGLRGGSVRQWCGFKPIGGIFMKSPMVEWQNGEGNTEGCAF
jgi:hypothetical protein